MEWWVKWDLQPLIVWLISKAFSSHWSDEWIEQDNLLRAKAEGGGGRGCHETMFSRGWDCCNATRMCLGVKSVQSGVCVNVCSVFLFLLYLSPGSFVLSPLPGCNYRSLFVFGIFFGHLMCEWLLSVAVVGWAVGWLLCLSAVLLLLPMMLDGDV